MKKSFYASFGKRFLDVFLCSLAVLLLSPICLITAIAIKLSSKGSVFYASTRAGLNGKPFKFYKFRSMHTTDHRKDLFVADSDRVFAVGKFIRRMKIDELPQLLNVIKGDMSIVGPRPMETSSVHRIYQGKYERVLTVKPGLTSAASLFDYTVGDRYADDLAYRREVLPKKLEMELLYVDKRCFSYDAELVWRTMITILAVMFKKKNLPVQRELNEIHTDDMELPV